MHTGTGILTSAAVILSTGTLRAQDRPEVTIRLEHGTEAEAVMARQLDSLLLKYDLEPWIMTRVVSIDERSIPHSHPVLTLHTRHIGDEAMLLSTFLHEQLHWLEDARPDTWSAAMREFRELFPEVPASSEGGARDEESTYRHLLVCDMEYQAVTALVGPERARETLAGITHYEWIYERVLNDPRVRQVGLRHGFDVQEGVHAQPTADSAAIRATALDYIEGWYTGDAERMERALHPHLAKRFLEPRSDGGVQLTETTALELVQQVRNGGGSGTLQGERRTDVEILDIFQDVASVRVDAHGWIDYMHLAKLAGAGSKG